MDADGVWAGGGLYHPEREQLARTRDAVAAGAAGELRRALDDLEAAGFERAGGGALKTAPRGFPREHPDIDLLRLTSYAALCRLPEHDGPAARDGVLSAWAALEPLGAWLDAHG